MLPFRAAGPRDIIPRMHNGFAAELARFGPGSTHAPVTRAWARGYCGRLARSHYENFTVASLLPRIERGSFTVDLRTLVLFDEAGMTDDHDLHRLLDDTTRANAKLVFVGDPRQLSAVGPGGGLEALVGRFDGHVWQLTDNIRQADLTDAKPSPSYATAT